MIEPCTKRTESLRVGSSQTTVTVIKSIRVMSSTKLLLVEVYCRRHVDVVLLSYGGNGFPDFLVSQISPQRGKGVNIFSYIVTHSATKTLAFLGVLPQLLLSQRQNTQIIIVYTTTINTP